jgi:hypothetical protein
MRENIIRSDDIEEMKEIVAAVVGFLVSQKNIHCNTQRPQLRRSIDKLDGVATFVTEQGCP